MSLVQGSGENASHLVLAHRHCVCGETHANIGSHTSTESVTYKKLAISDTGVPEINGTELENGEVATYNLPEGNYYLGEDIDFTSTNGQKLDISGAVNLCMNGYDLSFDTTGKSNAIRVEPDGSLTVTDCSAEHSGEITVNNVSDGDRGTAIYNNKGAVKLYNVALKMTSSIGGGFTAIDNSVKTQTFFPMPILTEFQNMLFLQFSMRQAAA